MRLPASNLFIIALSLQLAAVSACRLMEEGTDVVSFNPLGIDVETDRSEAQDELLNEFASLWASCGTLSPVTIPGGWQQVVVSSSACTEWIPLEWAILGAQNDFRAAADAASHSASFFIQSNLGSSTFGMPDLLNSFLDELEKESDFAPIDVVFYEEGQVLTTPVCVAVFTFSTHGIEVVGTVRVVATCDSATGPCQATWTGFWLPRLDLQDSLCAVAQVDASLECPELPDRICDDDACHSWCASTANSAGACAGEDCRCY